MQYKEVTAQVSDARIKGTGMLNNDVTAGTKNKNLQ